MAKHAPAGDPKWRFFKDMFPRSGSCSRIIREFKQITTAGATTAAVTEKFWGGYVSSGGLPNLKFRKAKYKEFKISFI